MWSCCKQREREGDRERERGSYYIISDYKILGSVITCTCTYIQLVGSNGVVSFPSSFPVKLFYVYTDTILAKECVMSQE